MSDTVIRVQDIGKRYRIGAQERATTFREALSAAALKPFRAARSVLGGNGARPQERDQIFWALKGVSFEVRRGEILGVIGRNGAGKSTLLKVLSRITDPTLGRVEIRGRVGCLLEVGTGFHPELTGRENIFLNGSILGLKKADIQSRFDEIVAFAEVEKFIDTPVKYYSSGMYLRLAFAVAAHLEPEILIVDEVLAVGDAAFQKKCLGKMQDVSKGGRTVILVSHNMSAVARLCDRSIWLEGGKKIGDGPTRDVAAEYQSRYLTACASWKRPAEPRPDQDFAFLRVTTISARGEPVGLFGGREAITVQMEYLIQQPLSGCNVVIRLYTSDGTVVFSSADVDGDPDAPMAKAPGHYEAMFTIPGGFLAPGAYYLFVAAHWPFRTVYESIEQTAVFEVSSTESLAGVDGRMGLVTPLLEWNTRMNVAVGRV